MTSFERLVENVRKGVETRSDVVFNGSLPGTPQWTRVPYSAELSRDWGDASIHDGTPIGYRVRLKEFGEKPREATFGLSDENVQDRIITCVNDHLNGPRDLS